MSRFEGRVVFVTGAAGGIGEAMVTRFAAEKAAVVVTDIDRARAEALAERAGPSAVAMRVDVTVESEVAGAIDATMERFGRLDVMVNNAGILDRPARLETKEAGDWDRVIAVNLTGTFYGVKHAARVMRRAKRGAIVNLASIVGEVGFRGTPAYVASKHGVIGLTKAAALELAKSGIRVVAVAPGFTLTPMTSEWEPEVKSLHPMGRIASPDEVASLILFLSSDEAGFITGSTHFVDGGYTAQ